MSWSEFFFLLQVIGEKEAEKAIWFKQKMSPYLTMKKGATGEKLFEEIQALIVEDKYKVSFFFDRIPVVFAVRLCSVIFQCPRLLERCTSEAEQVLVREAARAIVLKSVAEIDAKAFVSFYMTFSKTSEVDEGIGNMILEKMIMKRPLSLKDAMEEGLLLTNEELIKLGADSLVDSAGVNYFFVLYKKTGSKYALALLLKHYGAQNQLFDLVVTTIRNSQEENALFRKRMVPVLYHLFFVSGAYSDYNRDAMVSLLPEYASLENTEEEKGLIDHILDHMDVLYKDHFPFDTFQSWYGYAPKDAIIARYVQHWNNVPGSRSIKDAIAAYELCGDIRFKQFVVDLLCKAENFNHDIVEGLDWVKSHYEREYIVVKAEIFSENLLDKWWASVDKKYPFSEDKKSFVQLARHFC